MVKIHHFGANDGCISCAMKPLRATHSCSYEQHTHVFVGVSGWGERKSDWEDNGQQTTDNGRAGSTVRLVWWAVKWSNGQMVKFALRVCEYCNNNNK